MFAVVSNKKRGTQSGEKSGHLGIERDRERLTVVAAPYIFSLSSGLSLDRSWGCCAILVRRMNFLLCLLLVCVRGGVSQ